MRNAETTAFYLDRTQCLQKTSSKQNRSLQLTLILALCRIVTAELTWSCSKSFDSDEQKSKLTAEGFA